MSHDIKIPGFPEKRMIVIGLDSIIVDFRDRPRPHISLGPTLPVNDQFLSKLVNSRLPPRPGTGQHCRVCPGPGRRPGPRDGQRDGGGPPPPRAPGQCGPR